MKDLSKYIKDQRVLKILKLVNQLDENLRYPNSENSLDEMRYCERFENNVINIMNMEK